MKQIRFNISFPQVFRPLRFRPSKRGVDKRQGCRRWICEAQRVLDPTDLRTAALPFPGSRPAEMVCGFGEGRPEAWKDLCLKAFGPFWVVFGPNSIQFQCRLLPPDDILENKCISRIPCCPVALPLTGSNS